MFLAGIGGVNIKKTRNFWTLFFSFSWRYLTEGKRIYKTVDFRSVFKIFQKKQFKYSNLKIWTYHLWQDLTTSSELALRNDLSSFYARDCKQIYSVFLMLKYISRKIRVYFPLIARKTGRFRIDIKIRKNILLVDVQKLLSIQTWQLFYWEQELRGPQEMPLILVTYNKNVWKVWHIHDTFCAVD